MRIGRRLQKVLSIIDDGLDSIIDIGTDHGFLALKLIEEKNTKIVYATDISAGSLKKAQDLAIQTNNGSKIKCILSDGFENLDKSIVADVVVIAGMGGIETKKIIKNCKNLKNFKSFILQPMQDVEILREFLFEFGFKIVFDETVEDKNKFYHVIKCVYTGVVENYKETDLFVGITDGKIKGEDFLNSIKKEIVSLEFRKGYLNNLDKIKLETYNNILSNER